MKTIKVAVAVIRNENKVFATVRDSGEVQVRWEFPGGKIEEGETPQQALKREIKEQLDTGIEVYELIDTIEYGYSDSSISMDCFWCEIISGEQALKETETAKWLELDELGCVNWLPKDIQLVDRIRDDYQSKKEIKTHDELETLEDDNVFGEQVIIDGDGNKILKVVKSGAGIDLQGTLDRIAQFVNIADIVNTIKKGSQYVVQIPAQFQKQFDAGELLINRNKNTGIEWPALIKKLDNGKQQFVANLPIKEQEFVKGNPFQDIFNSYHNIAMQRQLAKIAMKVEETYEIVKRVELGQQDDRIAWIDAGKKQILLAMTMKDEERKKAYLNAGVQQMLLGKEQVGKAMIRRIEAFKELPRNQVVLFISDLARPGYLEQKDDEVEEIQDCYSMYIEATKMIAAVFAYMGELTAVEQTFGDSVAFLEGVDFSKIKSIEASHKDVNFEDWFFNKPVEYVKAEKRPCLESAKEYDYLQLEVNGEELLEVLQNGREEVSEAKTE